MDSLPPIVNTVEMARWYNTYTGAHLTHWDILDLPEEELEVVLAFIRARTEMDAKTTKEPRARVRQTGRPR